MRRTAGPPPSTVRAVLLLALLLGGCGSDVATVGGTIGLTRQAYADRLRAMWLTECIANWTGLVTENTRILPPFLTDEDWGTQQGNPTMNGGWIDYVFQAPWGADDDTDIEYIYLEAVTSHGRAMLRPEEIRQAWVDHIENGVNVWVSNNEARKLMGAACSTLPPSTSFLAANDQSLMIDAQLTTELFGAMAPAMPVRALALAELPIRVTGSGYAAHACQFYVALYSLAAAADPSWPMRERILWMVETARRLLPDTSKAADVIDFVLGDYLANPDVDDWERTRDAVADRYQLAAAANGFTYLSYYESPINLATGLMALLYGEGDVRRTLRIGTLSGWDCDNGTATMGGLLGLMLGTEAIRAAFPGEDLSDAYDILRTRVGFEPPVCEGDPPRCVDTFTRMASRMIPVVEREVTAAGGHVNARTGAWTLPRVRYAWLSEEDNPLWDLGRTSASNRLRREGRAAQVTWSGARQVISGPTGAGGSEVADGLEYDFSGEDLGLPVRGTIPMYFGFPGTLYSAVVLPAAGSDEIELTVTWDVPLELAGVRFIEGAHDPGNRGRGSTGGFRTRSPAVLGPDGWIALRGAPITGEPNPSVSFEVVEWSLDAPVPATGVRLLGRLEEGARFVTISELEGILWHPGD